MLLYQVWEALAQSVLNPEQPYALHQLLLAIVSARWDATVRVRVRHPGTAAAFISKCTGDVLQGHLLRCNLCIISCIPSADWAATKHLTRCHLLA